MTDEDVRTTFEGIVMHSILDCATPKPPQEVASKFYQHPYGGIARDVYVTREGFARFFEDTVECVDLMGLINPNMKSYDLIGEWHECLGYILKDGDKTEYRITIVVHDHSRVSNLLQIAPYLWKGSHDRSD